MDLAIEEIREIMDNQNNIRNISIISHNNYGKSTIIQSLISSFGISFKKQRSEFCTWGYDDEEDYNISLFNSINYLLYKEYDISNSGKKEKFLIYLVDPNISLENITNLSIIDGIIIISDYIEGIGPQTELILRQSLLELIKPILIINKIDKAIFEFNHNPELIYQNFIKIIDNVNIIISTYQNSEQMIDFQIYPEIGNVLFTIASYYFGFTLNSFAKKYSEKFKLDKNVLLKKLWGENYYNKNNQNWSNIPEDKLSQRGFCSLILEPLIKLIKTLYEGKKEVFLPLLENLGFKVKENKDFSDNFPLKKILSYYFNSSQALIEMIILHLPSPKVAQKYRIPYLYDGPMDDECSKAMKSCDPKGPIMMFVSRIISHRYGFYAFGRIFSGKIELDNPSIRILGPNYIPGKDKDLYIKRIKRLLIIKQRKVEDIYSVPCGNICALDCFDEALFSQITITSSAHAHIIKANKDLKSPIIGISINPKNPSDLPKLVSNLLKITKINPLVKAINTETEHMLYGYSEQLLNSSLKDLVENFAKIEINKSEPFITYKETVSKKSKINIVTSANKHNKLYVNSEPLSKDLINEIENDNNIREENIFYDIPNNTIKKYEDKFGINNIWTFGPNYNGPNLLVNQTENVQYINEIRDSMEAAFSFITKEGVLAEENLRGVRFNMHNAELHTDAIHRGGGQIIPAARRVYYISEMTACPKFQEPIYLYNIITPGEVTDVIYKYFKEKRGSIINEESYKNYSLLKLKGYLPVSESFGFNEHLNYLTYGQAFINHFTFSHWNTIDEDPFDVKSKSYKILMSIRERKGLEQELPKIDDFIDKI